MAVDRDEGAADLAALLGADRNVLQVRLGRGEAPRGGGGKGGAGGGAVGLRVGVAWQGVGVGRFELRNLPPVENLSRQRMTLLGKVVQNPRAGRPLSCLGLGAAGKAELAEQDVAQLLRA